ncbi:MAG: hypothetical protein LBT47_12435 [Deltaproteobacteria bacterium]|jgi:hypothetical protein|nr:hypothetical protein [Deltaproteobacteria bacterium]
MEAADNSPLDDFRRPELVADIDHCLSDMINEFARNVQESSYLFKSPEIGDLLNETVSNFLICINKIQLETSNPSAFASLGQLEQLFTELQQKQNDILLKLFINRLKHLNCENEIVTQKKTSTESTG